MANQNVGLRRQTLEVHQYDLEITTHPFQVSMDHLEVMHILQALCNINELDMSAKGRNRSNYAYKLGTVHVRIFLNEIIDITILHPLRNHRESPFSNCHPEQRQDIGMVEVLPSDCLSAEFLHLVMPAKAKRGRTKQTPTLRILPKLLVVYMRGSFAATCFPLYVHRETLAFPP